MGILKRLFCNHSYQLCQMQYTKLGWEKCTKCGKEKYTGRGVEFKEFNLGEFRIK